MQPFRPSPPPTRRPSQQANPKARFVVCESSEGPFDSAFRFSSASFEEAAEARPSPPSLHLPSTSRSTASKTDSNSLSSRREAKAGGSISSNDSYSPTRSPNGHQNPLVPLPSPGGVYHGPGSLQSPAKLALDSMLERAWSPVIGIEAPLAAFKPDDNDEDQDLAAKAQRRGGNLSGFSSLSLDAQPIAAPPVGAAENRARVSLSPVASSSSSSSSSRAATTISTIGSTPTTSSAVEQHPVPVHHQQHNQGQHQGTGALSRPSTASTSISQASSGSGRRSEAKDAGWDEDEEERRITAFLRKQHPEIVIPIPNTTPRRGSVSSADRCSFDSDGGNWDDEVGDGEGPSSALVTAAGGGESKSGGAQRHGEGATSQAAQIGGGNINGNPVFRSVNWVKGRPPSPSPSPPLPSTDSLAGTGDGGLLQAPGPSSTEARCVQLLIGGSESQRGLRSSVFSKNVCNHLICLQCNFK